MALDLGNATYGRDQEKLNEAKEMIKAYFSNIRSSLTGQEKQDYINAIKNSWSGSDAESYIKKVEYVIAQIDEYLGKLPTILENAIQEDYDQFQNFQKANAEQFE